MGGSPKNTEQQDYSLSRSKQENANADKTLGSVTNDMNYYSGDPSKSSLYRTLLTTGTDSTNDAYNSAKAATRLHSNISGFGYSSPTASAAETGIDTARAGDLAKVPGEALQTSIDKQMQAEGIKAGVGEAYLGGGTQNLSTSNEAAMQQQRLAEARRQAWMSTLNAAIGGASAVATGGVSQGGKWA